MDATSLATLWATVALVIFLGIAIYIKVPGLIAKGLDARAAKISNELEEARRLREEAQQLLGQYQKKRKEAEQEAADIVAAAKREAELLATEAHKKTEDYVARRTALAEQKIGQAEREAISEVRASAVDIAVEAARALLAGKVDAKAGADFFKSALQDVKAKLN
ncbi:MAG: F0F1 ATP synthase subunit B [Mesorhizobium sp.]|uniref:F0F1 ATP synthase subunit B n=1 Tax=unclassified Mesorhizobium TaxID=325217 RepID=UPI000F751D7A|nr:MULTISPECIES: F0F1 ATP synthase subunit B [unclassified Mesorhizobium]AZO48516.1 F0F1 ATP synthase subunit B [Mesorhizobium sp. M4B.F.Ca.ET.058.02.1.1]RVC43024.1 F0F1 ATP synthase subunit B [Mesorhizobium sp. M4A.F.Ca.ET.090.04.2.1]RVC75305.1 F0F1 ATP synthase subunit B [Mesorhizobium sp. M4A.F.Ca.ET.022.05.2.1]RWC52017.1 MAG: F0F1 ATP synthase subunit B [Mesorhizobium sp.]RWD15539.1 MAG: F0F1 ATP synthase subunit B [Mesorhizobium sp.]